MRHLRLSLAGVALAATLTTGCIIDASTPLPSAPTVVTNSGNGGSGRAPIIQALDYSPKSAGKDDTITFTVVATDLEGDVLQYNWSSTKGMLSTNSGQVVGWKPTRADGSFEPGLSTVTVIISDGRQTTTGTVNLMIDDKGQATVSQTVLPSPAPSAAPASPAPTPTPIASSVPSPSPTPSDDGRIPGKVLFEDGFETGLDQWKVGSQYLDMDGQNRWNPLGWKTLVSGAQAGKFAAVLNNADDTVPADTEQPNIWIYSKQAISLEGTVLPRVRVHLKSGALPSTAVNFKVFWGVPTTSGIRDQIFVGGTINVSSAAGWVRKDLDLSSLKGQEGHIGVMLEINRPTNASQGPMVDAVTVYDAGQ